MPRYQMPQRQNVTKSEQHTTSGHGSNCFFPVGGVNMLYYSSEKSVGAAGSGNLPK